MYHGGVNRDGGCVPGANSVERWRSTLPAANCRRYHSTSGTWRICPRSVSSASSRRSGHSTSRKTPASRTARRPHQSVDHVAGRDRVAAIEQPPARVAVRDAERLELPRRLGERRAAGIDALRQRIREHHVWMLLRACRRASRATADAIDRGRWPRRNTSRRPPVACSNASRQAATMPRRSGNRT